VKARLDVPHDPPHRKRQGRPGPGRAELDRDNIQGRTICALGDAAAMPVRAFIKQFREEFEYHIEHKHCLVPAYI
jgi:NADH-quinone oxidoreductase subunit F